MSKEHSVNGKLDKILDALYNEEHGVIARLQGIETAVIGSADRPGLCEKVRVLEKENFRQSATISAGISGLIILGWIKFKAFFGVH